MENTWRFKSSKARHGLPVILLHLLHAYDELYSVQFAIYLSEDLNRKFKKVILDNDWPLEKLYRCLSNDKRELTLRALSGIPKALFQFDESTAEKLKELHLNGCGPLQANNDFDQFGKFRNLSMLSLINCDLTKIPKELFNLRSLETVRLMNNSIKEIPHEISSLRKLFDFDISYNNLKTIDISIKELPTLEILNISNNPVMKVSAITNVLKCKKLKTLIVSSRSKISFWLSDEDDKKKFSEVAREEYI